MFRAITMWAVTFWLKRKREREMEANEAELIDEDPPAELEPPPPPPTIVMGDVQQFGMGAEQGIVEPTITPPPLPAAVEVPPESALLAELAKQRDALLARVQAIETMLGFVAGAEDLAVRVAKIERFLGI